ncbi:MAG: YidC/Oxa1 family membrane protein insertase [Patescibacteria group bacterium]|nr:YidC/Oxa1 family membrane protein insertase [Patescibacteria group bacterium]MDD4610694.1 YidC/Oxa1 family membrane protein insertase [Patescibacteria group bacterium]
MSYLFTIIFYQPILNLLVWLYNIIPGHDIGIAIIVLTIIIKVILYPLSWQSIKAQKSLQDLQPKVDELKKEYANNKEEMGKAMLTLYKENKVNPFSSCLPLLIQLPFLWAVFRVFQNGLKNGSLDLVYSFISKPDVINNISLGLVDLSKPNIILAVLAGAAQFWQAKMMTTKKPPIQSTGAKDENMMAVMNKQMLYMMPVLTVFIGLTLPGGLTLYWFITTLLTALQQLYMFKKREEKAVIIQ